MTSPVNVTDEQDTNKGSLHKDLTDLSDGFSVLHQFEIDTTKSFQHLLLLLYLNGPRETKACIARMPQRYKKEEDKANFINTIVKLTLSEKMVNPGEKSLT